MSEKDAKSSRTPSADRNVSVPDIPAAADFNDDSKVPFLTFRTFSMTVIVSIGGICFGYDTGLLSSNSAALQHANTDDLQVKSPASCKWRTSGTNLQTTAIL